MIHNVEINIKINLDNLSQKEYLKLINEYVNQIAEYEKITFNDLIENLSLNARKYQTTSIEYPEMTNNDELTPKETKIEIIG